MSHPIYPHGDFKQLDENLWTLEGSLPHKMPLPRTMTVYRMNNGGLWVHSAVALDPATQRKLESFGPPKFLVVPSTMHRLDAPHYKALYPHIRVVCPEAAKEKVQQVVAVDNSCENEFQGSEVVVHRMNGAKPIELAYEIPLASGGKALVINDVLVNVRDMKGLIGKALKLVGRIGEFRSPPSNKMILLDDRQMFRGWLDQMGNRSDIKVVTVAHGEALTTDVAEHFRQAARQV